MATKKVASKGLNTAASHDRSPTDVAKLASSPAVNARVDALSKELQPKAAAQPLDQVKKAAARKPQPIVRKETLASVKATSSKAETEKTAPYVLMRKATKPGAKATRSIVNFITVGDTAEASHVRPMRIAIVGGEAYGTNLNVVSGGVFDVRKARFFEYGRRLQHGKSAKTVQPWDIGNENAIRALEKLGAISKHDLEFHLEETKRRQTYAATAAELRIKITQRQRDVASFKALGRKLAREHGITFVRQALRASVPLAL